MKMKKTLTAVVAMALVAAVSVAGTLAFLSQETKVVTNTFTAGKLGENLKIELLETPVQQKTDGTYELTPDAPAVAEGNNYTNVLPGSTNAKDPHVNVTGLETDAYVFVEVLHKDTRIQAEIEDSNWILMPNATSKTPGAKVYKFKATGLVGKNNTVDKAYVLKQNQFTVDSTLTGDTTFEPITVKAYICQAAGLDSAENAWETVFAPQV